MDMRATLKRAPVKVSERWGFQYSLRRPRPLAQNSGQIRVSPVKPQDNKEGQRFQDKGLFRRKGSDV